MVQEFATYRESDGSGNLVEKCMPIFYDILGDPHTNPLFASDVHLCSGDDAATPSNLHLKRGYERINAYFEMLNNITQELNKRYGHKKVYLEKCVTDLGSDAFRIREKADFLKRKDLVVFHPSSAFLSKSSPPETEISLDARVLSLEALEVVQKAFSNFTKEYAVNKETRIEIHF